MKIINLILVAFVCVFANAQITPNSSPFVLFGSHTVIADSVENITPNVLWYRPQNTGSYPVFIFQPGANGFFSNSINRHSYDLYMKHLASYGYVVIVVDETTAGLPNGSGFQSTYDWFMNGYLANDWQADYADTSKIAVGGHSNGGVNATNLILQYPNSIDAIVYLASYPSNNFLLPHDVSQYPGAVLSMSGSEDSDSSPADVKTGYNAFNNMNCGVYLDIEGMGHGGFGDYDNSNQPVGTIGRSDATASVRHYLVSFLEYILKENDLVGQQLLWTDNRLTSVSDFETSCTISANEINEQDFILQVFQGNEIISIESSENIFGYQIFNLSGQLVNSEVVRAKNIEINASSIGTGFYLLQVLGESFRTETYKLFLE